MNTPVYRIHLSNVCTSEPFRQHSYLSLAAGGLGLGAAIRPSLQTAVTVPVISNKEYAIIMDLVRSKLIRGYG